MKLIDQMERRAAMRRDLDAGDRPSVVAKRYGVHTSTAMRVPADANKAWLAYLAVYLLVADLRAEQQAVREIMRGAAALAGAHIGAAELARLVGVSRSTAYRHVRVADNVYKFTDAAEAVAALRKAVSTRNEVARELDHAIVKALEVGVKRAAFTHAGLSPANVSRVWEQRSWTEK